VTTVAAGNGAIALVVNDKTDTVYVGNIGDGTVSVIDGATCNAQVTSGCGQTPATVQVPEPLSLAVDSGTDTVYVVDEGVDFATGVADQTSTVSTIDGSKCNGSHPSGCAQAPSTVPVGGFPWGVTVDPMTHDVYVTSIVDSTLGVFDGKTCNGHTTSGCHVKLFPQLAGGWPNYIGLDPGANTIYVPNNVDGTVSLFPFGP
jgi:DNA-binding beta-propeller fold protein YncE